MNEWHDHGIVKPYVESVVTTASLAFYDKSNYVLLVLLLLWTPSAGFPVDSPAPIVVLRAFCALARARARIYIYIPPFEPPNSDST